MHGPDVLERDWTTDEEVGFMILADQWQCLHHMREAWSAKK